MSGGTPCKRTASPSKEPPVTIIVYKEGVMAADTGAFRGPFLTSTFVHKVRRTPMGALIGCSGEAQNITKFHDWAMEGFPELPRPEMTGDDTSFGAIVVEASGRILEIDRDLTITDCTFEGFAHEGEGFEFAFALHTLGLSAEQIIAHSIKHCVWAAGEVFSRSLNPPEDAEDFFQKAEEFFQKGDLQRQPSDVWPDPLQKGDLQPAPSDEGEGDNPQLTRFLTERGLE